MGDASQAVRVQVVFQGGGAKLCVLMAVCEVLRDYETEGKIQITRVAGSSAGAIAAVMLASERSIEAYRERLKRIAQITLKRLGAGREWEIWRVLNGRPYFGRLKLDSFFHELICKEGGPQTQ